MNGMRPYTYTLYSQPNKKGQILASDTIGVFGSIPMHSDTALSCMIQDACGAYFHVNFYPQLLADLQITWFDGGLRATTTCEGSTITVHTLQSNNLQRFVWRFPDGTTSTLREPTIFIPRGAPDGYYKVTVLETGCRKMISDSIYLTVSRAPYVRIQKDTTICPGQTVPLTFTPISYHAGGSDVEFSVVFKSNNAIETRHYTSPSGVSVTDTFVAVTPTKIFPVLIQDSECGYGYTDPDDTTYISISSNIINPCTIYTQHDYVCYEGTGHLAAKSTTSVPYTIRWYSDMNQTQLLKEEEITNPNELSYYDTSHIVQQTMLFVSVDKDGYCPSVNGVPTNVVNMQTDTLSLNCDQAYQIYDSGGKDGDYASDEIIVQSFIATDGRQIVLLVDKDEWNLSNTSHLLVISGTELLLDSVMYDLTNASHIPDIIISNGNALTLYFMSGAIPSAGWSALVEPVPGIAIANVHSPTHAMMFDEVCQSQSMLYSNPNISSQVATQQELNEAIKRAGTHIFSHTYEGGDRNGCDSVFTFVLTVTAPPHMDTTVVTSNFQLNGSDYEWHGQHYSETGRYSVTYSQEDGCDSLDILNLIILKIDTSTNEICIDESTIMGITVETPHLTWEDGEIPMVNAPGDVLCMDGSVMKVDSFLHSDKTAKGVVYYVDVTGLHGKAIALVDAPVEYAIWAIGPYTLYQSIHAKTMCPEQKDALYDMDGNGNTMLIKEYAEQNMGMEFAINAPAAYYCYYYDATIRGINPGEATGWWMPSMGELNLLYGNRVPVNSTLLKLAAYGAEVMNSGKTYYLSSSEANNSQCWHNDYSGHFATNTKSEKHRLRATIDF